ncbi:TlpA disulfide reductase family protein [Microbacterium sp. MPKO10]|uniref:TlpA family protein disulfide reductase n=1 Tax=Microbacterium sp. MPKO10 TaxID=2989818 RepID=UPI002236638F|nr:TlpA disulfide reductase family protein [Microbacterium sp. MPKO10]MCW4456957.1 TlpA family protein disulfide reductase [Microbacterium sp. MPKO10]
MTRSRRTTRMLSAAAAALATVLLVAGCSEDPLAEQYKEGSGKGYIAGDGSVMEIAEDDRGDAVEFTGTTESGDEVSSDDFDGQVVVVNFWYASCAPCRAEAPILDDVYDEYAGDDVAFIGVNLRDQAGTAASFNTTYDVSYPSIIDVNTGSVKLAFADTVPPNSVPTTIVLDKQGRVSARILGALPDASILSTLVEDAVAE